MARDLGRFVNGANRSVEELEVELLSRDEVGEACRSVKEFGDEAHRAVEGRE